MDRKRDELIVNVDVDREVTWDDVNRKSRVPKGDASTAAKHESVYMRASIWGLLYRSFYMGQQSTQRTQQSTYGSLYMGACIWERLYGSFYMGASIWELLYGSFYMRACTVRYQCVTNALLVRYSVRYPSALPPFSLVLQ